MKRQLTCSKCGSVNVNVIWEYAEKDEIAMMLCHDGWGLQYEDAKITCAKCGSSDLDAKKLEGKTK